VACVFTFLADSVDVAKDSRSYPALERLVARCEALQEFVATRRPWFRPSAGG